MQNKKKRKKHNQIALQREMIKILNYSYLQF